MRLFHSRSSTSDVRHWGPFGSWDSLDVFHTLRSLLKGLPPAGRLSCLPLLVEKLTAACAVWPRIMLPVDESEIPTVWTTHWIREWPERLAPLSAQLMAAHMHAYLRLLRELMKRVPDRTLDEQVCAMHACMCMCALPSCCARVSLIRP